MTLKYRVQVRIPGYQGYPTHPRYPTQKSSMCQQAEAKRFLGALAKRCELSGSSLVSMAQLYALADNLELNVSDTAAFVADLNDAGAAPCPLKCSAVVQGRAPTGFEVTRL